MTGILFQVTMALYFVGTVLFLLYLLRRSEVLSKWSLTIAGIGFAFHTVALLIAVVMADQVPIMTFKGAMSFFAWALVAVFLIVALKRGLHVLGAFILRVLVS